LKPKSKPFVPAETSTPADILTPAELRRRMVGTAEVLRLAGLSQPSMWRRIRDGSFPRPAKLTRRKNGWPLNVIMDWLDTEYPTAKNRKSA
jgi:predicted DNA-binding transcriptional regulator AlpA